MCYLILQLLLYALVDYFLEFSHGTAVEAVNTVGIGYSGLDNETIFGHMSLFRYFGGCKIIISVIEFTIFVVPLCVLNGRIPRLRF